MSENPPKTDKATPECQMERHSEALRAAEEYAQKMGGYIRERTDGAPVTLGNLKAIAEVNAYSGFLAGAAWSAARASCPSCAEALSKAGMSERAWRKAEHERDQLRERLRRAEEALAEIHHMRARLGSVDGEAVDCEQVALAMANAAHAALAHDGMSNSCSEDAGTEPSSGGASDDQ